MWTKTKTNSNSKALMKLIRNLHVECPNYVQSNDKLFDPTSTLGMEKSRNDMNQLDRTKDGQFSP